ncbi:lipoprotein, putative [Parvularcula bermudensis HTCC2503]|uniref:Lipoprotein, putative n=1 Tax=Parvularcula bermudensis (strain ATCC BAA-594 / HTCC2503 / KCTC 12087) TaxID=314260 RepID=E0TDX8_PARBH|nr:DUF3299 domain-containing protein [Parvularcula bermudensis]ADM10427.1 lipoprotein, putative [Parvularcula bermudensis HTCC2503]
MKFALIPMLVLSLALQEVPRSINWGALVPAGDEAASAGDPTEISHDTVGKQSGSDRPVRSLDGEYIRMPGFMLPLDYTEEGMVTAFLLVPYYGACIHVPPPPPNQIVFVKTEASPVRSKGLWDPVWVTGTLLVAPYDNDLGDAAYTLTLDKIEPYTED